MLTRRPAILPHNVRGRVRGAVTFLRTLQVATPFPGAWPSIVARAGRQEHDWNAFTTALTADVIRDAGDACGTRHLKTELHAMTKASHPFLRSCGVTQPAGAYRFWPVGMRPRSGADVDDTALAHLVIGSDARDDTAVEYMRLFSAYRLTRGCRLHAASSWARAYPGAFGTWMDARDVVVDAGANANVVRLLHKSGARTVPGYRAAVTLLGSILSDGEPPTEVSPYYRSGAMLAWLCAGTGRPDGAVAEESALRAAVEHRLLHARKADDSFATVLLTESAKLRSGLPADSRAISRLFDLQCSDGGWPEIVVCWNFSGTLRWTSRSFPSALALELLIHRFRGKATC